MPIPRLDRSARKSRGLRELSIVVFPLAVWACAAVAIAEGSGADKPSPPNIILILADDLGFNQIGVYGDTPIRTPNLDRLAANGVRFTDVYSGSSVCSPSRVSLFTGRDGRLLKDSSNTVQLEQTDVTLPMVLKYAGYDTALFGKYSIGGQMGITDPLAIGFDTWFGMYGIIEGHRQYPTFLWRDNQHLRIRENEAGQKGVYAQERFTEEAIDYLNQPHTGPFFVLLSYTSPHAELAVPSKYSEPYEKTLKAPAYEGMAGDEANRDRFATYYPEPVGNPDATLAGMVTALDDYVGQIVAALEANGNADNTLILFTSDNGPHEEGGADPERLASAAPFRGRKRDLYDGGIHVPMIASWPGRITRGRVDNSIWAFADVLPTFADLAHVPLNRVPRVRTNGLSIAPRLSDDPQPLPERTLYWEFAQQVGDPNSGVVGETYQAARRNEWKAVRYGQQATLELYNLDADPGEQQDLADDYPKVVREFAELFEAHE